MDRCKLWTYHRYEEKSKKRAKNGYFILLFILQSQKRTITATKRKITLHYITIIMITLRHYVTSHYIILHHNKN